MRFPVAQSVENLPAMQETWVRFLSRRILGRISGWEDPLEKEMTTHFLPGESPWTEEADGLQSMGLQESDMT